MPVFSEESTWRDKGERLLLANKRHGSTLVEDKSIPFTAAVPLLGELGCRQALVPVETFRTRRSYRFLGDVQSARGTSHVDQLNLGVEV